MLVLVSELEISREPPKFGLGKGVGGWVEWFCWGVKFWLANFVFGYFAFCFCSSGSKECYHGGSFV